MEWINENKAEKQMYRANMEGWKWTATKDIFGLNPKYSKYWTSHPTFL